MKHLCFIIFLCSGLPLLADTIVGNCGENLQWSFDTSTSHLTITGYGEMNLNKYPGWINKDITIKSVSFQYGITSIDSYAFEEQALTSVAIPASVEKFGRNAFANMPSLLRFDYQRFGYADSENGILYNCYNLRYFKGITRMLSYCTGLDTIIITYGYAITNHYGATYIDNTNAYDIRLWGKFNEEPQVVKTYFFPDNLEVIGDFLFCNAHNLDGIVIPYNVHTIGHGAFFNCISLDSLVFTSDVIQTIGDSAFCNCIQLNYIKLCDTIPPTIEAHTFEGVDTSIPIYIPANCSERYQADPYWSRFFNFIEPVSTSLVNTNSTSDAIVQKHFIHHKLIISRDGRQYDVMGRLLHQSF